MPPKRKVAGNGEAAPATKAARQENAAAAVENGAPAGAEAGASGVSSGAGAGGVEKRGGRRSARSASFDAGDPTQSSQQPAAAGGKGHTDVSTRCVSDRAEAAGGGLAAMATAMATMAAPAANGSGSTGSSNGNSNDCGNGSGCSSGGGLPPDHADAAATAAREAASASKDAAREAERALHQRAIDALEAERLSLADGTAHPAIAARAQVHDPRSAHRDRRLQAHTPQNTYPHPCSTPCSTRAPSSKRTHFVETLFCSPKSRLFVASCVLPSRARAFARCCARCAGGARRPWPASATSSSRTSASSTTTRSGWGRRVHVAEKTRRRVSFCGRG